MHALGQLKAVEGIHHEGYAALAGLAVDPHNGLVLPANIAGIDGQVGNLPKLAAALMQRLHALVDGVLVGAGECGEHQLARVGMPGRNIHLGAALINLRDLADIFDVQLGIDSLGEHVVGHGQNVHVAGALAVAKQGALHPVRARKQRQLRGSHALAAVVVGVNAQNNAFAVLEVRVHPLNLIRVDIGGGHLNGGREIDDNGILLGSAPCLLNRRTDIQREIQLRAGKALRGILQAHLGVALRRIALHQLGADDGDILDFVLILVEHHVPL